jgi:hypothetical protein
MKSTGHNGTGEEADLDSFRIALNKIYNEVVGSYQNTHNLIGQINIHLDNLRKKFVKSGIFTVDQSVGKNIVDWMINELEVCLFSDESLIIDENGFYADVIITKNAFISSYNWPQCKNRPTYLPQSYKEMYNKVSVLLFKSGIYNRYLFLNLIKFGIFDISILAADACNCVNITLAFHLLSITVNHDYYKALCIFIISYKCNANKLILNMLKDVTEMNLQSDKTIDYIINACKYKLKLNTVILTKKTKGYEL